MKPIGYIYLGQNKRVWYLIWRNHGWVNHILWYNPPNTPDTDANAKPDFGVWVWLRVRLPRPESGVNQWQQGGNEARITGDQSVLHDLSKLNNVRNGSSSVLESNNKINHLQVPMIYECLGILSKFLYLIFSS